MSFVKDLEIREHEGMATAIVRLSETMEVLSNAPLNGGHALTDVMFITQVPHNYNSMDYLGDANSVRVRYGLPEHSVGFMTAAEVKYVIQRFKRSMEGFEAEAIVTAGLSNHVEAGEEIDDYDERHRISMENYRRLIGGTINIIEISSVPLKDMGRVNAYMPIVEAKTLAMRDAGYEESGTTSDAMAIVSPRGDDGLMFTGTGTPLGMVMAQCVRTGVYRSVMIREKGARFD